MLDSAGSHTAGHHPYLIEIQTCLPKEEPGAQLRREPTSRTSGRLGSPGCRTTRGAENVLGGSEESGKVQLARRLGRVDSPAQGNAERTLGKPEDDAHLVVLRPHLRLEVVDGEWTTRSGCFQFGDDIIQGNICPVIFLEKSSCVE